VVAAEGLVDISRCRIPPLAIALSRTPCCFLSPTELNSTTAPTWYIDGNQVVEELRGQLSHHRSDAPLGYATKVHALAYVTRFREVLMVDSDCTLLVRPEDMFDIPEYQHSGNLFWPGGSGGGSWGQLVLQVTLRTGDGLGRACNNSGIPSSEAPAWQC
jgi:hypothetical protein